MSFYIDPTLSSSKIEEQNNLTRQLDYITLSLIHTLSSIKTGKASKQASELGNELCTLLANLIGTQFKS